MFSENSPKWTFGNEMRFFFIPAHAVGVVPFIWAHRPRRHPFTMSRALSFGPLRDEFEQRLDTAHNATELLKHKKCEDVSNLAFSLRAHSKLKYGSPKSVSTQKAFPTHTHTKRYIKTVRMKNREMKGSVKLISIWAHFPHLQPDAKSLQTSPTKASKYWQGTQATCWQLSWFAGRYQASGH